MWKNGFMMFFVVTLVLSGCAPYQESGNAAPQATDKPSSPSSQESTILTAAGDSQQVVIHWQRSGGFAGICQEMDIFGDGSAVVRDCGSDRVLASGNLPEQERLRLKDWLETFQQFSWRFNPPKGSADMFLDEYTFSGIGEQSSTEQENESINQELANTAQLLVQLPTQ